MRLEIIREVNLTEEQEALLGLHSFINVIAVITAQLQALGVVLGDRAALARSVEWAFALKEALPGATSARGAEALHDKTTAAGPAIREQVDRNVAAANLSAAQRCEAEMIRDAIRAATAVLELRTAEYLERTRVPPRWLRCDPIALQQELIRVLRAIEANAMGRYRIVFTPEEHDAHSYLVRLEICAAEPAGLLMPAVLHDVMRDLVANARKYTSPGGTVHGQLSDSGRGITIEVRDNGRGIPQDALEQVVGFGYRAENALDTRAMGGGFGLTKAYVMTKRFGGRMWIESELGQGTTVTCVIPRPPGEAGRGCRGTRRMRCR